MARVLTPQQQTAIDGYLSNLRDLFSQISRRIDAKTAQADIDTIVARFASDTDSQLQGRLDTLEAKFTALYQTVGLSPQYIDECEGIRTVLGFPLKGAV